MKNKIIVLFLCSLIIPVHFSFAFGEFDIGGKYNPIYIQEVPDTNTIQKNANAQKEDSLKRTYGINKYLDCSSAYDSSCGITANLADTYTQTHCLLLIQSCLESKSIRESYAEQWDQKCKSLYGVYGKLDSVNEASKKYNCGCEVGYQLNTDKNQCVIVSNNKTTGNILDSACQSGSGVNSFYSGETDVSKGGGMAGCSCKSGFQFEHGNYGQCVTIPAKSNNQTCQDKFGLNSTWNGTLNDKGGLVCDCNTGYQWNMFKTQCNLVPIKKIVSSGGGGGGPVTTVTTPKVVKTPEVNIIKEDIKEIIPNVTKIETASIDTKVVPITSEVKHKSLWTKIKGWFGL